MLTIKYVLDAYNKVQPSFMAYFSPIYILHACDLMRDNMHVCNVIYTQWRIQLCRSSLYGRVLPKLKTDYLHGNYYNRFIMVGQHLD